LAELALAVLNIRDLLPQCWLVNCKADSSYFNLQKRYVNMIEGWAWVWYWPLFNCCI